MSQPAQDSHQETSQFALLGERRYAPLFVTQALGAFNDNVYKNALVILIGFGIARLTPAQIDFYVNLAGGLFILPFFLFSATAGQIAEKYDKALLIRFTKVFEIAVMLLAAAGFALQSLPFLLAVLFLMGTQAALFGPVKYSILPQHLRSEELVGGNAMIEAATFLAILLGTMLGGWLIARGNGAPWVSAVLIAVTVAGWLAARFIPPAPPAVAELRINWNPYSETRDNLRFLRGNRVVLLAVLGISWFWFYGAMFLSQLPNYTKQFLGGDASVVTLLLTIFSVGIGIGSLLCERMSGRQVEIGLVPLGSIGLTIFGIDLFFAAPNLATVHEQTAMQFLSAASNHRIAWDLLLTGVFGGFYIVPLYALIQLRTAATHRSRVIAGNNILNALFMVGAALLAIVFLKAGLTIPQLLLTTALMNAAVAVFIYTLAPEFLMRLLVWLLINTLYRIRKTGLEHIPDEGPVIVAANHVSYVDALIIGGNVRRPIRFVMYHKIFRIPVLSFIFRTARAIPIAPAKEDEALMHRAFDEIAAALEAGDIIGIFPEGQLTRDGEIGEFRSGIEKIVARTPAPVVPMALRGLWGSFFSRNNFLARMRLPSRFWSRIELVAAAPIPPAQVKAADLEQGVRALRGTMA
ncbi:MFS transporter [Solimonas soli]|uniref:MFS transporter n=1 Tax=Solimonas soli TaxID=413479 RepID=UPI0004B15F91|nr:MFS transporter [Solimonas soli]